MADSNVNIRITTDGGDKLKKLVADLEAGKLTLNEITQLKKELNATFKTLQTGSEEWDRYAGMLAKVNDFQRDVRVATKAGHEEYFKLGLEIRQLTLASGLLGGNFGKLTNTMSGAISGAIGLKQALVPLGIQFGAMSMGIAASIVALPALINLYDELSRKAAANLAGKQGAFIEALMGQAQGGDAVGAIERLDNRIKALRSIGDTAGLRELGVVGSDESEVWELKRKLRFEQAKAAKREREEDERNAAIDALNEINVARGMSQYARGITSVRRDSGRMGAMQIGAAPQVIKESIQQLTTFERLAITASGTIANSITGTIGTAWDRVFGRATTLLGQFANTFASQMLSLASNYGLGMLLATIGGPVGGIGVSILKSIGVLGDGGPAMAGRPYIVGERGPELFVPSRSGEVVSNAKASRFGAMAMAGGPIVLETRIRGNDLVLVQAKASQSRRGRTM